MRKFILAAIAYSFFASTSHAQISKKALFLGGSVGYSKSTNESTSPLPGIPAQENTSTSWSVRPQVGTPIATNQILGLFLNFGKNSNEQKSGSNLQLNESSSNGGGLFYRRYYPFSSRFFIFGDASLGINFGKTESTNDNGTVRYVSAKTTGTGFDLSLTPGLSFAASRKLFLESAFNSLLALNHSSAKSTFYDSRGNVQSRQALVRPRRLVPMPMALVDSPLVCGG